MTDSAGLAADLERAFADDERPAAERRRLLQLMILLVDRPLPPDPFAMWPEYADLRSRFLTAAASGSADAIEERFLALYCHLHGYEAPYTLDERRRMDELGGYWCHAGGLSPLLKAADHIAPETVSADFGAGNGLQGLLLQKLYPHARTVQIELSSRMVAAGQVLQSWLGIAPDRVEWIVGDVLDQFAAGTGFRLPLPPGPPRRRRSTLLRAVRRRPGPGAGRHRHLQHRRLPEVLPRRHLRGLLLRRPPHLFPSPLGVRPKSRPGRASPLKSKSVRFSWGLPGPPRTGTNAGSQ